MDDYEIDCDEYCPRCARSPIHWRRCANYCCEDGYIDLHEFDDPLWFDPGEVETCPDCRGTGIEKWCPMCGADLSGTSDQQAHQADAPSSPAINVEGQAVYAPGPQAAKN